MNRLDTNNGLVRNPEDLMSCLLGLIHAFISQQAALRSAAAFQVTLAVKYVIHLSSD